MCFNLKTDIPLKTQLHLIDRLAYKEVWDFQTLLHQRIKSSKMIADKGTDEDTAKQLTHLLLCEHLPVYTLGKSAGDNFVHDPEQLKNLGFEIFKINRGGDITYHGPGQITGYLIIDLELLYRDVHKYVRNIELAVILTLNAYGIEGKRLAAHTGVWVERDRQYHKVCAIGVHLSKWVSMHGFALNVNTTMDHFSHIVPCGIAEEGKVVTSMSKLLGKKLDLKEVMKRVSEKVSQVFNLDIINPQLFEDE